MYYSLTVLYLATYMDTNSFYHIVVKLSSDARSSTYILFLRLDGIGFMKKSSSFLSRILTSVVPITKLVKFDR